ncbi:MAG: hypothetical protein QM723_24895 [Myxococcaceae bacterium]
MATGPVGNKPTGFLNTVKEFKENHEELIDTLKEAKSALGELKEVAEDGFEMKNFVKEEGLGDKFKSLKGLKELSHEGAKEYGNWYKDPTGKLSFMGKLGIAGGAMKAVTGFAKLPGEVGTAIKDVRDAIRNPDATSVHKAVSSVGEALETGLGAADYGSYAATTGQKLYKTYHAASEAFAKAAPAASKAVRSAAAKEAMKQVFEGTEKGKDIFRAVKGVATETAKEVGAAAGKGMAHAVGEAGGRSAAKATIEAASHAAAEAAVHAGAEAAGSALARGAARFAPGVNVAMAAIDTGVAIATLRDPKASTGSKVCSCITAVGSIAAATNIPVVSQIGAGVSIVSSFVGGFFK